ATAMIVWTLLTLLSVLTWAYLLIGRQGFWRAEPRLPEASTVGDDAPPIAVIIPARDEAETIGTVVRSLLAQNYPGRLHVIVVDDQSSDDTAAIVDGLIPEAGPARGLGLISNTDRPAGWSGKLWAIKAGLDHLETKAETPAILLLTDADIAHDSESVSALLKKMVNDNLDLVSVMVRLRNRSFWERLLIPPFVFFFQMLYPFNVVNEPNKRLAAAAGGCVLLRRDALDDAGGIEAIKGALIDDVALGRLIKFRPNGKQRIWLGHAERTVSLRAYEDLSSIWQMVVRTADTQLDHSLLNLIGTVMGMVVLYLLPPLAVLTWPLHQEMALGLSGLAAWSMMSFAFGPTSSLYRASMIWLPTLPFAAVLYTAMTVDSARRYRQGKGGVWKGRAFQA
ncbi:MAG: glycosyltransferase, partial [Geminicoccaceae bacterium]